VPEPLSALIDERSALIRQLAELGDFSPVPFRVLRSGAGGHPATAPSLTTQDTGPNYQLTQKIEGKTVTQSLPSPAAVCKAESEIAQNRKLQHLTDDLVSVNRKICRLRPKEQTRHRDQGKKRSKRSRKKSPAK